MIQVFALLASFPVLFYSTCLTMKVIVEQSLKKYSRWYIATRCILIALIWGLFFLGVITLSRGTPTRANMYFLWLLANLSAQLIGIVVFIVTSEAYSHEDERHLLIRSLESAIFSICWVFTIGTAYWIIVVQFFVYKPVTIVVLIGWCFIAIFSGFIFSVVTIYMLRKSSYFSYEI